MENNTPERKDERKAESAATLAQSMTRRKAMLKPNSVGQKAQTRRQRKSTDQFVGRRKTSVARVALKPGSGVVTINNRKLDEYFPRADLRAAVLRPLEVVELAGKYDIKVNVYGGGITGQAKAISLGIARSIDSSDSTVHTKLKIAGLLTRDPRMVERKKYGLHKARRATQFSKR